MIPEEKFCKQCGQVLREPTIFTRFGGKPTYYKFEDGYYCSGRAVNKVQEARRKNENKNKQDHSLKYLNRRELK